MSCHSGVARPGDAAARGMMRCLLVGAPNCGKSTLFNRLTKGKQKVGNWHGKTVECKEGECSVGGRRIEIVDLPGTYSMTPFSAEERAAVEAVQCGRFDVVLQVADACHLERSLFFTLALLRRCGRVVVALNKADEAKRRGIGMDASSLERAFGAKFVLVSAKTGEGVARLLAEAETVAKAGETPARAKLTKGKESGAKEDHEFVQRALFAAVKHDGGKRAAGVDVDRALLNPWLGIPIFIAVMWLVFQATFVLSTQATEAIDAVFSAAGEFAAGALLQSGSPPWAGSLVQNGIIAGVGSVLVFAPAIFVLFFLLHALEDTGYLARIAVILDGIMGKTGLPGRAAIPLILGFGCNVPAIRATRILDAKEDRLSTMLAVPFMSCSARFQVFVVFAGAFFAANQGVVLLFLYFLGAASGLLTAFAFRRFAMRAPRSELAVELPDYQVPSWETVASQALLETTEFAKRAGTIILACSVLVWFLASMPTGVEYGSKESYAGALGSFISPLFAPLGFGNWQASISLMFGGVAKEVVVSAMASAYGAGEGGLSSVLASHFTPLSALSFMVFVLLYVPCIATIVALRRESGSTALAVGAAAYYVLFAWVAAFLIYNTGLALGF